ncbi:MAG: hypothetical protein WA175_11250 [Candidatus Acidiferrales bacterium]
MDDWAEIGRALDAMAASGSAEVREDGEWLAELAALHCELRREGKGKGSVVHLWSGERNLTRRVVGVRENLPERIVLDVQRFGRAKPGRLEFLRSDSRRSAGRITREQFRARFRRALAENFPDATVDSLTAAPDLEHSFSGLYVRGRMHEGSRSWAIIAAAPGENSAAIEGILAFGILWLDWTRNHARDARQASRAVEGLRIFVPHGASRFLRARVLALSSAARTGIFEFREADGHFEKQEHADAANLESWLMARPHVESLLAEAREAIAKIHPIALHRPPAGGEIGLHIVPETREVALCFRGLEFGRWSREGIFFGLGDSREKLTQETEPALDQLIRRLDLHRNSLASETNHPLYRAVPERWIETLVLEDPARLDAQLDPRHLYSQVPALAAGDRGVLDLLGVTRRGRLVVIELKASEDIQMSVQAVDYWLRVRRHQREGDFLRFGYFTGVDLDPQPPLLWLVAPALRFHSATETLLKYFSPEIHCTRIGLNENWRRGLKIIFRQQPS